MKQYDLYRNISSPSIERLFVAIEAQGRLTKVIYIWRNVGEDAWNARFNGKMYTADVKQAKEGTSRFLHYIGKIDFESAIIGCLVQGAQKELSK